jgi:hypothetical protein
MQKSRRLGASGPAALLDGVPGSADMAADTAKVEMPSIIAAGTSRLWIAAPAAFAKMAATSASSKTLHREMPATLESPTRPECPKDRSSALRQQHIYVGGGATAEVVGMGFEEFARGTPAFIAQHCDEFPFAI